jgi:hypothetical protein
MPMKKIVSLLLMVCPLFVAAQKDYSKDVASVDALIKALYDVISGDPGQSRDWDRFRYLFTPEAKLIPTGKNAEGKITHRVMSPEEYVQMFTNRITTGFFERELYQVKEEFGTIVHVFSTYETKEKKDGPVTNRGINSIQLLKTNERYYVMNIFWCAESLGFQLPDQYLPKK